MYEIVVVTDESIDGTSNRQFSFTDNVEAFDREDGKLVITQRLESGALQTIAVFNKDAWKSWRAYSKAILKKDE